MNSLWQDARFAVRSLRRSAGLTLVVLTTLSIGIAVVTTFYSLLNTMVFRPLPYPDADRIVMMSKKYKSPDYIVDELIKSAKSIERIALHETYTRVLTGLGEPVSVSTVHVDSGFFPLLRLTPLLGALPSGKDVIDGAPTIVFGERLWRQSFNADPAIIGKTVTIHGTARRVVAVLRRDFALPVPWSGAWIPMQHPYDEGDKIHDFIARLAPGATHEDVHRDIALVNARLHAMDPTTFKSPHEFWEFDEMLNRGFTTFGFVQPVKLVIAASACVLLIACTNLALLMIVRGARRRAEMVVRAALGASRWQLIRQQVVESVILAGTAGVIGTVLSMWGVQLVIRLIIPSDRQSYLVWLQFGVDWRVAMFALGVSFLTVAIVGIWPASAGTRFDLAGILRSDADHGVAGRDPTRSAHLPIVLQLTLSLALFAGAVMLGLTYREVARIDLGYEPKNLYDVAVASDHDSTSLGTTTFFRQVRDQLMSMPGVEASLSSRLESFNGEKTDAAIYLPGAASTVVSGTEWRADPAVVSDDYFKVMRTPMLAGRTFTSTDGPGSAPVAIVSKAFALKAWGSLDVMGKTLVAGKAEHAKGKPTAQSTLLTVVGVAGDFREPRVGEASLIWSRPDVYVSDRQARFTYSWVLVRSTLGPVAVRKAVAAAVERAGRQLPITVNSREEQAADAASSSKALAMMMAVFAVVSLALALMGIYGIVAFSVEQRTREVGIRVALGAQASDIIRVFVAYGARLTAIGLGLGLLVAVAMGRIMSSFVVGAVTSHVLIAIAVTTLFAGVALVASYLPARRAARLDPVVALRR